MTGKIILALTATACLLSCAAPELKVQCAATIPAACPLESFPPAMGGPKSTAYQIAFEAFWWNCVMVKAANVDDRCPFRCGTTPCESQGCVEGAKDAAYQIKNLLKYYPRPQVQQYLQSLSSTGDAKKKIKPYFQDTPRADQPH